MKVGHRKTNPSSALKLECKRLGMAGEQEGGGTLAASQQQLYCRSLQGALLQQDYTRALLGTIATGRHQRPLGTERTTTGGHLLWSQSGAATDRNRPHRQAAGHTWSTPGPRRTRLSRLLAPSTTDPESVGPRARPPATGADPLGTQPSPRTLFTKTKAVQQFPAVTE
ncbi:hypothetical protein NDU88_007197 [Pleurodeles waltl]|uniref:Uncharacterized protein n=1 Tax=Pleurodeles waltl TaxID=8319 RepID=A0AAV7PQQ5_PLEWA|nr:hypothetical protein NDU88_007197 [Pleurodeles waltl]